MSIYDAKRASAKILIGQKGVEMTLENPNNQYTISGGSNKNPTTSTFVGVLLPATKNRIQNFGIESKQANSNVTVTDFLIASSDEEIKEGKRVVVGQKRYTVVGTTIVDPDNTGAIIYKAGLRSE